MYEHLLKINAVTWSMLALILTLSLSLQGCLLGVKEITTSGGTSVKFVTGTDFHFGLNGVDTVDHRRGIAPDNRPRTIKATN